MGHYLYGIVSGENGTPRISGGVEGAAFAYIVGHKETGAVVSDCQQEMIRATGENLMAHERVLEEILKTRTVLPFEFGTIAPDKESVVQMLSENRGLFKKNLAKMEGKLEFNVKAIWQDMPMIFQEIVAEHPAIAHYKAEIAQKPPAGTYPDRIRLGTMVAEALGEKKRMEENRVCRELDRRALDVHVGQTMGDEMIANRSYLIRRGAQKEFEEALYGLGGKYEGRINFKYVGPLPPYSFVHLPIQVTHAA